MTLSRRRPELENTHPHCCQRTRFWKCNNKFSVCVLFAHRHPPAFLHVRNCMRSLGNLHFFSNRGRLIACARLELFICSCEQFGNTFPYFKQFRRLRTRRFQRFSGRFFLPEEHIHPWIFRVSGPQQTWEVARNYINAKTQNSLQVFKSTLTDICSIAELFFDGRLQKTPLRNSQIPNW